MTDLPRVVLLFGCVAVVVDDARALVAIPLRTEDSNVVERECMCRGQ